jgi:hypothetical protein
MPRSTTAAAALVALTACRGDADVTKVEGLIHATLADRPGIHAAFGDLSDGDSPGVYFGFARFDGDAELFQTFCRAIGANDRQHLPAAWGWTLASPALADLQPKVDELPKHQQVQPPWWKPALGTPRTACGRDHGLSGWIVAKLEDGHVYLIVTGMGSQ